MMFVPSSGQHAVAARPRALPRHMVALAGMLAAGALGCKDLTGNQPLPAGTNDPSFYNTPAGALGMRTAAIYELENTLVGYIVGTGLLTDELTSNQVGSSAGVLLGSSLPPGGSLDARILPDLKSGSGPTDITYGSLQTIRADVHQAVGALATYDPTAPVALRGELYALEGYAEILLADYFCSGVPLSTLDYQQDYTYAPSSTSSGVYHDAVAKLDTALTLSTDSARLLNLARVLRGRAWLDLGQYDSAAAAVQDVPPGFQYQVYVLWTNANSLNLLNAAATVSDQEGLTGLPYRSSDDPRTAVVSVARPNDNNYYAPLYFPAKYNVALTGNGYSPFTVADYTEAQLIQAEAQLQPASAPRGPWLARLNRLRASVNLSDTTDPGTAAGRVALLFRERAFWLFVTGHRQGDLRRLLRQYGEGQNIQQFRGQSQVYPSGPYTAPGASVYGSDVTAPIPPTEYTNPLFHGCIDRDP